MVLPNNYTTMGSGYEKIQELITLWSVFEQQNSSADIREFGRWLCSRTDKASQEAEISSEQLSEETQEHIGFYKSMPPSRQFLTLTSRSARFIDFYIKKAFEDLEISSRQEFQFLITIKEMKKPRKTDVIYFNLVEISTGVEILNRLQRNKMIRDFSDKQDKRIKRIQLTPKGEKLVAAALQKFDSLDQLTHSFGQDETWKSMIAPLIQFNDYHNEVYHKYRNLPFKELMELLESDF